jgi:thiol-disulfide isomerase/thioredoxin
MVGAWVVLGVVVVGLIAGWLLRRRDGRISAARPHRETRRGKVPERNLPHPVASALDQDSQVTLVQVSTTFCASCRHARAVLSSLAGKTEGLHHVELDVADRPEVARALGVLRTPTTLAFAPSGEELLRISGVPPADAVLAALAPYLDVPPRERGSRGERSWVG